MKIRKSVLALTMASVSLFAGCGKVVEQFDPNKTQIIVKVFNGGFGVDWIEDVIDDFNAANEEYEVIPRYKKETPAAITSELEMNSATADIYYSTGAEFQTLIYNDYLEDLSDVLEMKPDGESGRTIKAKMKNYDSWQKLASKHGEGTYIVPYADAIMGLVYNHERFVDLGWLSKAGDADTTALSEQGISYEKTDSGLIFKSATGKVNYVDGDVILTAGKDGKYGTYDDGQPQTIAEFNAMINKITKGNKKADAFSYNGINDHYTNWIAEAVAAQYMGPDMFEAMFTYDTKGEAMPMHDGTAEVINGVEDGYKVFKAEGVYKGLEFINTYFNDTAKASANSFKISSYSHTDAQNDFILGNTSSTGFPAMLVEGGWWENEARPMFKQVEDDGKEEYGFGKVEYRYMLLPYMEGQQGIDGNGNGSVMCVSEASGIIVPKCKDKEKLAKIKEFIAMTTTDAVLEGFTRDTGVVRPYDYQLSSASFAKMTPFAKNMWELYNDADNVKIVRPSVLKNSDPLTYTSAIHATSRIPIKDAAVYNTSYLRAIRNLDKDMAKAWKATGYSQSDWNKFIDSARNNGFFTE